MEWREWITEYPYPTSEHHADGDGWRLQVGRTMWGTWMAELSHGYHVKLSRTDFVDADRAKAWAERAMGMMTSGEWRPMIADLCPKCCDPIPDGGCYCDRDD